jgi:hypothetical protein
MMPAGIIDNDNHAAIFAPMVQKLLQEALEGLGIAIVSPIGYYDWRQRQKQPRIFVWAHATRLDHSLRVVPILGVFRLVESGRRGYSQSITTYKPIRHVL